MKNTNMTAKIKKSIENFLIEITNKSEIDIIGLVTIDDIDTDEPFESIKDMISDNNGFDVEIIYYGVAIEYLAKNDPSLRESMELAGDMGYEPENINSELLASLLASQNERENFENMKNEIEEFFQELNDTNNI